MPPEVCIESHHAHFLLSAFPWIEVVYARLGQVHEPSNKDHTDPHELDDGRTVEEDVRHVGPGQGADEWGRRHSISRLFPESPSTLLPVQKATRSIEPRSPGSPRCSLGCFGSGPKFSQEFFIFGH